MSRRALWIVAVLIQGLEPRIQKYDLVFSGVQFLLGPDRQHHLTLEDLFARWTVVQLAAVAVLATGARLALPWARGLAAVRPDAHARGQAALAPAECDKPSS